MQVTVKPASVIKSKAVKKTGLKCQEAHYFLKTYSFRKEKKPKSVSRRSGAQWVVRIKRQVRFHNN